MDELKVMSLTLQEVAEAVKMREALAVSVVVAEKLIREVYHDFKFDVAEERIKIWSDGNSTEYLTNKGVWQARYLHRSYDVPCTMEGIFEALKGGYFMTCDATPEIKERAQLCSYFKRFLERTQKLKEERGKAESSSPFQG